MLKQKPLSAKQIAATIIEEVELYFQEYRRCKLYWKIYDDDVSNFDETGF